MDEQTLDTIIARYEAPSGRLLGILGEIQDQEGYIPRESLAMLSEKLDVRLSQLYSLTTFYSYFSLTPVRGPCHHGLHGDGLPCQRCRRDHAGP